MADGSAAAAGGTFSFAHLHLHSEYSLLDGGNTVERAVVAMLTFVLAVPVAVLILALALVALVLVLGCAAIWFALAIAIWIVGRVFGIKRPRVVRAPGDGRENVRVIPPRGDGGA